MEGKSRSAGLRHLIGRTERVARSVRRSTTTQRSEAGVDAPQGRSAIPRSPDSLKAQASGASDRIGLRSRKHFAAATAGVMGDAVGNSDVLGVGPAGRQLPMGTIYRGRHLRVASLGKRVDTKRHGTSFSGLRG